MKDGSVTTSSMAAVGSLAPKETCMMASSKMGKKLESGLSSG
jgi:hypothetical protein